MPYDYSQLRPNQSIKVTADGIPGVVNDDGTVPQADPEWMKSIGYTPSEIPSSAKPWDTPPPITKSAKPWETPPPVADAKPWETAPPTDKKPWETDAPTKELSLTEKVSKNFQAPYAGALPYPEAALLNKESIGQALQTAAGIPLAIGGMMAQGAGMVGSGIAGLAGGIEGAITGRGAGSEAAKAYQTVNEAISPYLDPHTRIGDFINGAFDAAITKYKSLDRESMAKVIASTIPGLDETARTHIAGALYGLSEALPELAGVMGMHTPLTAAEALLKRKPAAPEVAPAPTETPPAQPHPDVQIPDVVEPQHQLDLRPTDEPVTPWKIDENGMPYKTEVSEPVQRDLFSPEARTPDDVIHELANEADAKPGFMRTATDKIHQDMRDDLLSKMAKTAEEKPSIPTTPEAPAGPIWHKYIADVNSKIEGYKALASDINDLVTQRNAEGKTPTFGDFAELIGKHPITLFDKFITSKLMDVLKDVPIRFEDFKKLGFNENYAGMWDGHTININKAKVKNTVDLIHTLNHEAIHAAVAAFIDRHPLHPFVNALYRVLEDVRFGKGGIDKEGHYGTRNIHEFLSELANPHFVDRLARMDLHPTTIKLIHDALGTKPTTGSFIRSAWSGFVQIMGKVLGFSTTETNAAAASMHLFNGIVSERTVKNIRADTAALEKITNRPSEINKRQTADLRSNKQFQKEELPKDGNGNIAPLKASEDISRMGRLFNVADIARQFQDKLGGKWLSNVISNVQEISITGSKLYKQMADTVKDYNSIGRTSQKRIAKTWISFDGMLNDELKSRGLQWPTAGMLAEKGLTPKEIAVYQSLTKAFDKSWGLIEQSFKKLGGELPPRIPGYFPHFWVGSWRVVVSDSNGKPSHMEAFSTRYFANRYLNQALKEGAKAELKVPSAEVKANDLIAEIVQANTIYKNKSNGLGQAILKTLTNLDAASKRGIIKDVLERKLNLGGHEASKGIIEGNPLQNVMGYAHNNRLLSAFQKHLEDVSHYWAATEISMTVGKDFHEAINSGVLENVPNTRGAINEFIARATGHPVNHFAYIDETLRGLAIKAGLPPNSFHNVGGSMAHTLAFLKLMVPNPRFIISNVFQPLTNIADISLAHMERVVAGEPTGDLAGALSTFLKESVSFQTGKGSPILEKAMAWARENGVISVIQADHLNPLGNVEALAKTKTTLLSKLPNAIEEKGRAVAFLEHYMYYRTVMTDAEALQAAKIKSSTAMGNYERMNSASMYTDFGIVGQSLRPFGILRNVYYGKAFQAMNLLMETIRTSAKDPSQLPKVAAAATPITLMMGQYLMMAGASGMLLAAEYDYFVKAFNAHTNPENPWPTSQEIIRRAGAPDWMVYGAIGNALGWDIGPSINAPAMTELGGVPMASVAMTYGKLAKAVIDQIDGRGMDMQEVVAASQAMIPNIAKPWIRQYIAQKQSGGAVIPKSNSFTGDIMNDPNEDMTYKIFGAKKNTEVEKHIQDSLYKYGNGLDRTWKQQQVSKIVDAMVGLNPFETDGARLFRQTLEAKRGFDKDTLNAAIEAEYKSRVTTQHLRDLEAIQNSNNQAEQVQNLNQMQQIQRR